MRLSSLRLKDFRCFSALTVEFGRGFNVIAGPNGAGKTSILEAIAYLSRGRSLRSARTGDLIRGTEGRFSIYCEFLGDDDGPVQRLGCSRARTGDSTTRLNANSAPPLYELANLLPIQIVDAELHKVIAQGASHRRRFFDWGVFHVERDFYVHWQQYGKALRQRNHLLRTRATPPELAPWDQALAIHAQVIDAARRRYLQRLYPYFAKRKASLLARVEGELHLTYRQGWAEDRSLEAVLGEKREQDRKAAHTTQGPHRADVMIDVDGHAAKQWLSRGQQKMAYIALVLAQLDLFRAVRERDPVLLLDDLSAELDSKSLGVVTEVLMASPWQTVATLLESGQLPTGVPVFHVEP